ncbi:1-acyl-sn-glycerol-3-phosphate acyltransferase [Sulfobacillus thermosulfidooxidans]|uniref:1-acyl-sn-glycerol-3-phosphate acyltransferase n=1 Tax=Sulfobacillus thermosulfidooxidans TaxID=28034 RepID=UPI0006B65E04|nr:1-acyl-sn-glycerol-3-phosphate acyltransferase [Sulfobacillus thermosulfidooxidans]
MIEQVSRGIIVPVTQRFVLGQVEGTEYIPESGGYLIVANHASFIDHFVVATVIQRARGHRVYFLTKKESFEHPVSRWWHTAVGCIPLNRQAADSQAIRATLRALNNGQVVCVYPEGTRTPTGFLQPGKPGVILLAALAHVPIVPMGITGTFDVLPKHRRWPRRHRVTVRIGESLSVPLLPRHNRDAALTQWMQMVMERLSLLTDEPIWPGGSMPNHSAARYWNEQGIEATNQHQTLTAQRYHERAYYITQELLRHEPPTADVLFEYGRALGRLALAHRGLTKIVTIFRARRAFERVVHMDHHYAHALYALGLWHQTVPWIPGRLSDALSYFSAAVQLVPDQIGFWMGLGRCAIVAHQWELAEHAFHQAAQLPAQTVADQRRHYEAWAWLLRWHPEREINEVKTHA